MLTIQVLFTGDGLYGPFLHHAQRPVGEVHGIALVPAPTRRFLTEEGSAEESMLMSGPVEQLSVLVGFNFV